MNLMQSRIKTTIFIGLGFAVCFFPYFNILDGIMPEDQAIGIVIWSYLACYSLFLTAWGRIALSKVLFPLIIAGIPVMMDGSIDYNLFFSLLIFSWIRSICFPSGIFNTLFKETLITGGGVALMLLLASGSIISLAIGVWLFFLVQSLYFALFLQQKAGEKRNASQGDAFENARKAAEKILSGSI